MTAPTRTMPTVADRRPSDIREMLRLLRPYAPGETLAEPPDVAKSRDELIRIEQVKADAVAAKDAAQAVIVEAEVALAAARGDREAVHAAEVRKHEAAKVVADAEDTLKRVNIDRDLHTALVADYDRRVREADELRRRIEGAELWEPVLRALLDAGAWAREVRPVASGISSEHTLVFFREAIKKLDARGSGPAVNAAAYIDRIPAMRRNLHDLVRELAR